MSNRRSADVMTTRFDGPSPEVEVSTDMIKRGVFVAPVLIAICAVIWGLDGAWSSAYGIAIVLANFALAALFISTAARISLGMMMAATMFGSTSLPPFPRAAMPPPTNASGVLPLGDYSCVSTASSTMKQSPG